MAQLLIKNADEISLVHELTGLCTVGRHLDNTIVLDDVSVSGHHAELFMHNGDYLLKDLFSSNGTFVNGSRILIRQLKDGDQIRFGHIDAAVSMETAPEPPAPGIPPPLLNEPADQE